MRKTRLYIIPGFGESTRAKNYRTTIQQARKLGFKVVPVNIRWASNTDMSDFINQADQKIPDDISNDYILGFSFGAYVASVLSVKKDAKGFIFCSLSPYFKDQLKNIPVDSKKFWGKKVMKSFGKYSLPTTVDKNAWFLIGLKDWAIAIQAAKKFSKSWLGKSELYLIEGAGHELGYPEYTKKVVQILKML